MPAHFLDVLVLLGALQGFIISLILFLARSNGPANRWLAALLLILSLASLNIYLINQNWFDQHPVLNLLHEILPMVVIMPAGPLIYFYTRTVGDKDFRFSRRDRRHFYSTILDLIPHLVVLIYLIALVSGMAKPGNPAWGQFIDQYNTYVDLPRWVSLVAYLWISHQFLQKSESKVSTANRGLLQWPGQLLTGFGIFALLWSFHLIPYLIPALSDRLLDWVGWYPVYIPGTILIYWLSIRSYQLIHVNFRQNRKTAGQLESLPGEVIGEIIRKLRDSMEKDRLFLNPDLNLEMLAGHLRLPPKTISAVLNQALNSGFKDFINEYRIREIQARILEPQNQNLTIAGIAFDCGFNSQPTFQRAFKAITGQTPTQFMQDARQEQK